MSAIDIAVTVNGRSERVRVEPRVSLAELLRNGLELTGTHVGCEQGMCGACTVLVDGELVRSCLMFAVQADGSAVETVEGPDGSQPDPVQAACREALSFQCAFCAPGFILTARELLKENGDPTELEVRMALARNLRRCTG